MYIYIQNNGDSTQSAESAFTIGWGEIFQIIAIALPIVLALLKWLIGEPYTSDSGQRQILFRSSLLRIAGSADGQTIATLGRVPLELRPRQSKRLHAIVFYFVRYMFAYIFLRPSSRKTAFAIRSNKFIEDHDPVSGYEVIKRGGVGVHIELSPSEDMDHFRRSLRHRVLRRFFVGNNRDVVIADLGEDSQPVRSFELVKVDTRRACVKERGDNTVELVSAKRLQGARVNRRKVRRQYVPKLALWLINPGPSSGNVVKATESKRFAIRGKVNQLMVGIKILALGSISPAENDPKIQYGPANDHLEIRSFRFFVGSYTFLYLLGTLLTYVIVSDGCLFCCISKYSIFGLLWLALLFLFCLFIVTHLIRFVCFETGRTTWSAGTTRCIRDGDILRDGR